MVGFVSEGAPMDDFFPHGLAFATDAPGLSDSLGHSEPYLFQNRTRRLKQDYL